MGIDQQARKIFDPEFGSDNDSQHHKMSGILRKTTVQLKKIISKERILQYVST